MSNRAPLNGALLNGTWSLPVITATVVMTATAGLSAAATRTQHPTAAAVAVGVFTSTPNQELYPTLTFRGNGFLNIGANQPGRVHFGASDLIGRAVVTAVADRVALTTITLTGAAQFIAIPPQTLGEINMVGVGDFTATATKIPWAATVTMTGAAVITAAPYQIRGLPAPLVFSSRATLLASTKVNERHFPYQEIFTGSTFTFNTSLILNTAEAANFICQAVLTATPTPRRIVYSAPMVGGAVAYAELSTVRYATASLASVAALNGVAVRWVMPTASATSAAAFSGPATLYHLPAPTATAVGTFAGSATRVQIPVVVALSVTSFTAAPVAFRMATATPTGVAVFTLRAYINLEAPETGDGEYVRPRRERDFTRPARVREFKGGKMGLLGTTERQSREIEDYTFSYDEDLSATDEVTAIELTECSPTGLTITPAIVNSGRKVTFFTSGGVTGTTYKVTVLVETTEGRKFEDELKIRVKDV